MELEAHITVASEEGLEASAERLGLRVLHIVLDRGAHASQPMVSWRGDMEPEAARARLSEIRARLSADGHEVLRVKLEAPPEHPTELYLEQHVKLRLPVDAELGALAELGRRHGAHLSRNARRVAVGASQRFLTQRHPGPWSVARPVFEALVRALTDAGHDIEACERESVLLDTALELDDGWLT